MMRVYGICCVVALALFSPPAATTEPPGADKERTAYLQRRAAEKAAAEMTVAEMTKKRASGVLSHDDYIRLAQAYNELGDNVAALESINLVPEADLAKRGKLDAKAVYLYNFNCSGGDRSNPLQELAFYDRCIDRKYGNAGLWLWRKASLLCRTSVVTLTPRLDPPYVRDREQYEYAFETLKRAFEVEPKLLTLDTVAVDWLWSNHFPLMCEEARYKKLMGK